MANEIKLRIDLQVQNGSYINRFNPGQVLIDQAAIGAHAPIVTVGTSEEDFSTGDVGTFGVLCLRNLDATNFVTYGPKSGGSMVPLGKLKPGEVAVIRLVPGIVLRWQADTAAVKVQTLLLED